MPSDVTTASALDPAILAAIRNATTLVLETMAFLPAVPGPEQSYPAGALEAVQGESVGWIRISSPSEHYVIALGLPLTLARHIVSQILAMSPEDLQTADISDGIGELLNVIAGNTKAQLARESEEDYTLTIPEVAITPSPEFLTPLITGPFVRLDFESDGSRFHLLARSEEA